MCKDKLVTTSILQNYVLHCYNTYILHKGIDRTDTMIFQHLYWPDIINTVRMEVTNCDTYQRTKRSNETYGKLTAKLAEEIPWNKICVDLIGPYVIRIKVRNKTYT